MNEQEISNKLAEHDQKIGEITETLRKAKKYLMIIIVISIIAFVVPLL